MVHEKNNKNKKKLDSLLNSLFGDVSHQVQDFSDR